MLPEILSLSYFLPIIGANLTYPLPLIYRANIGKISLFEEKYLPFYEVAINAVI